MKRNSKHFTSYREKAAGASLCRVSAEPILELRAKLLSLAGFSRDRDTRPLAQKCGCHPNLGGTADCD